MTIVIFERVLTHYRLKFYNYLVEKYDIQIIFLTRKVDNNNGFETNKDLARFKIVYLKYFVVGGFEFYLFPASIIKSDNILVCVLSFKSLSNTLYICYRSLIGKKSFFWGHSRNFSKSSYLESFKNYVKLQTIIFSSGVLAYTEKEQKRFELFGIPSSKIIVLNNTIDSDSILEISDGLSDSAIAQIAQRYSLENKRVIGLVGRLHKLRNTEFGILAFINLEKSHSDLVFLIIGGGDEYLYLKNKYVMHKNIVFLGAMEDEKLLAPIIYNISFFINPGLVGLNIAHTMMYGKTTVVMDNKYHSPEIDYLIPDYNGILTDNSMESFQNGISRLLNDSLLLADLSNNSCIYAKANLTIDNMAKNFMSIVK